MAEKKIGTITLNTSIVSESIKEAVSNILKYLMGNPMLKRDNYINLFIKKVREERQTICEKTEAEWKIERLGEDIKETITAILVEILKDSLEEAIKIASKSIDIISVKRLESLINSMKYL